MMIGGQDIPSWIYPKRPSNVELISKLTGQCCGSGCTRTIPNIDFKGVCVYASAFASLLLACFFFIQVGSRVFFCPMCFADTS